MKTAKRIIVTCLTAAMALQSLAPSTQALALELDALSPVATQASGDEQSLAGDETYEVSDDVSSDVSADGGDASTGDQVDASQGDPSSVEDATADDAAAPTDGADSSNDAAANDEQAASDADVAVTSAATYSITTLDQLKTELTNGGHGSVATESDGKATRITFIDSAALVIISNAAPLLYQNAEMTRGGATISGLDLTSTVKLTKGKEVAFQGFGSEDEPFEGSIDTKDVSITAAQTIYNGLSLTDANANCINSVSFFWKGDGSQSIIANKVKGNEKSLNPKITITDKDDGSAGAAGALLGSVEGSLKVGVTYAFSGQGGIAVASSTGNAGLLVNDLETGATLTIASVNGIDGAKGTPTISATGEGGCAGGLIGAVNEGASVVVESPIDVSSLTVTAKDSAGGFIGKATKLNLSFDDGASIKPAKKVGDASTTYAGGAIGSVSFASDQTIDSGNFDFGDQMVGLGATKRAGGLFGTLDVTNGDVTVQGGTYRSKLSAGQDTSSNRGSYGGIAGNVCSTNSGTIHALTVTKKDDASTQVEIERASNLRYVGGIAGYQGDDNPDAKQKVAIVLDGAEVQVNGDAFAYVDTGKLGGAVGVVDTNNVLDVRDFKLTSASEIGKQNGGSAGIAGSAWRGIIKFSGTTDLSEANFADSDFAAQLVYQNYNALIFATGSGSDSGWTFKRPNTAVKTDDIYSYGEVIRLGGTGGLSSDLIQLDANTHVLTLGTDLQKTDDEYVLNTADDFAKLAITWQTFGYFSMVEGISGGSVKSLASSTIDVLSTINLAGTGLTGLSKDRVVPSGNNISEGKSESTSESEADHYFSGTLRGSGAINLAVGEPYGMRNDASIGSADTSDGNGKIYRHQRLGLFNTLVTNAKVEGGVTVGGAMSFENKAAIDAGSLAAQVQGNTTISGGTFSAVISYSSANANNVLNVGGISGLVAAACTVDLSGNAKSQATIKAAGDSKADCRVGEAFGAVGDYVATVNASSLVVGGSIDAESNSAKNLVGGFIGYIAQGGQKKYVNITGLSYNGFSMTVGNNGDPKIGAGGLLGYSWGNSIVTIGGDANNSDSTYALTTNNASVTANSATEFGGLLYVMSGHLVIQNRALDLSGASLSATSATSFGVLLARGAKESTKKTFGGEDSTTYTGLYLEDRTAWDDAYRVSNGNNKISISAKSDVKYFDEWVANVTKASQEKEGTTNDNDWNAVISLHTQAEKLDMSGKTDSDNSYRNRTEFGMSHQTNSMTRYYYNLDRCWDKAGPVFEGSTYNLTTPEALVIWNVCCYAPDEIRAYIAPSNLKFSRDRSVVIGSVGGTSNTIDLTGYSYYPTNNTCRIAIQNTTITFAYSAIKTEQGNNKSNASATQHANMHASLIRAFAGDSGKSLSVTNVTLAGSTGIMVNDNSSSSGTSVSGALVCRSAYGTNNKTPSVAAISIDGLTLDGLVVDGAEGIDDKGNPKVAPLLINDLTSCVTLNVKNLSVRDKSYIGADGSTVTAASSLFGNLGGNKTANTLVNAAFSNNVSVPSEKSATIFTRASFFESFGYGTGQSGSANYTFNEADKITFGAEIDSQGEYANKQLWYYDAAGYGDASGPGLVSDGTITANSTNPQYGDKYLPYVNVGKNGTCYHEMKVNQRAADLVVGCGTYSDPYGVRTANELYALTNYINDQNSAVDEWKVTITADQKETCTRRQNEVSDSEVTYQYSVATRKWARVGEPSTASVELDNDVMHRYLQSAYYSIEPAGDGTEIKVDANSFNGFGSLTNPFRGVIVGNLKDGASNTASTINIELADDVSSSKKASLGLIPYSYGSVVRQLNVTYSGGTNRVAYANKDVNSGTPGAFFGGVIGCVMGGDNIIDGVSVSGGAVTSAGDKAHLVPIGGYVGVICGGGVIFRNMGNSQNWRSATEKSGTLYNNPYIGRVVDGYAFSEGCELQNGNKNYAIVQLSDSDAGHIKTTGTYMAYSWQTDQGQHYGAATVQVDNAKGLLILSAIINSGAAAGAAHSNEENANGTYRGSRAYEGCSFTSDSLAKKQYLFGNEQFGKVRNATYEGVGDSSSSDLSVAKDDDQKAPGNQNWQGPLNGTDAQAQAGEVNSPYLVKKYADWATGYICATGITGVQLKLTDANYDMSAFETAYQGLSGRYYSNACVTSNGVNARKYITPAIACIDGTTASNGSASITVTNNYKEYTDDDYRVSGVGGLFNNIAFTSASYVESSIRKNDEAQVRNLTFSNCNLSISYIDKNGKPQTKQDDETVQIGVGCLAGVTSNLNRQENQGVYKNVVIDGCSVTGGASAGGLIGSVGYMRLASDNTSRMVAAADASDGASGASVKLVDCLYKNSTISAEANAGGFVGKLWKTTFSVDVNEADQSGDERVTGESANLVGLNSTVRGTAVWSANKEACTVGGLLGLTAAQTKIGDNSHAENPVTLKNVVVTTDTADKNSFVNTRGLGGAVGRAESAVSMKHVSFESAQPDDVESPTYVGSLNASKQTSYGTRYMDVGGLVGYGSESLGFADCQVSKVRIAAYECSGGLVGVIADGKTFDATGIRVESVQVDGAYSGGVLGQAGGLGNTIAVTDSVVNDSAFKTQKCWWAQHPDGAHSYSGGIVGDAKGTIRLSNVLVSKNSYEDKTYQGQLFGDVASGDINGIYASGIDIQLDSGKTNDDVPGLMHYRTSDDAPAVNKKCFFAFADYNDVSSSVDGGTLYNDERADDEAVSSASPYVTTNPVNSLAVKASSGKDAKKLFGDGVDIVTAGTIKAQAGTTVDGRYTYTNIGGRTDEGAYQNTNSYDEAQSKSTFADLNPSSDSSSASTISSFNVLLIPGNDTTTVTNYLNLVTNGGFSDAVKLNASSAEDKPFVSATVKMVKLEGDSLVVSDDTPSLRIIDNGGTGMGFRASTSWDNGENRFTLLTVTFNDGADHTYKVQVPIVVKRMLEIDFSASYTYGTDYKSDDYPSFRNHVLTGVGDAMTGYLRWTYNEAQGVESRYGLDTLLQDGGSLKPVQKSIVFTGDAGGKGTLPEGTQLTLVDKGDNANQYSYTVKSEDTDGDTTTVALTKFVDSSGGSYQERWLSELMGVTAAHDDNGRWTILNNPTDDEKQNAVAKVGGAYYRLAVDSDQQSDRYNLSLPEEKTVSEDFYLVVRVPQGSTKTVNGNTQTAVSATGINIGKPYMVHLGNERSLDNHENTESTYSIAAGYAQSLTDEAGASGAKISMALEGSDTVYKNLKLNVLDTITLGENEYNEGDSLFFQLNSSLVNFQGESSIGAVGYPDGAKISLSFFVKVGDDYYVPSGDGWKPAESPEQAAVTKNVTADGKDLEMTLSDANGNALDLKAIRKKARDEGLSSFSIRVKADVTLTDPQCQAAIMASQTGDTAYTKPTYRSMLSTHANSLSTSNSTAVNSGNVRYYRPEIGSSTIALVSTKKTQLGINVNDLGSADGTIALVGTYDFSKLNGADALLQKANTVKYALTLQQRADNGTYIPVTNIDNYIEVKESDHLSTGTTSDNAITFTDTKGDDGFATRDGTSLAFKHRFVVKVNTDVEAKNQWYDNYRLVLTARMYDSNGNEIDKPVNADGTENYPDSDYVTYTLTRVNTEGIPHS